jgi:hypothetical protein
MINKKHLSSFSLYAVTASLTVFFLVIILRLWQADFRIPFLYAGDGMISALTIKGLIENGWVSYNSLLGAPFGSSLSDFHIEQIILQIYSVYIGYFQLAPGRRSYAFGDLYYIIVIEIQPSNRVV